MELDAALQRLAEEDASKAELVKLRYFAGRNLEEAGATQAISRTTALPPLARRPGLAPRRHYRESGNRPERQRGT